MPKNKSTYEKWKAGEISNFGSFHTALLELYSKADQGNQEKLANAFPDWFKTADEYTAELDKEDYEARSKAAIKYAKQLCKASKLAAINYLKSEMGWSLKESYDYVNNMF